MSFSIYSVGPTIPKLVFPLEKGITQSQTSVSIISKEIKCSFYTFFSVDVFYMRKIAEWEII
jgi:hypothetical protein